ncbi:MAG: winged helix-turn-helix transcriptional regulator [Lentisphaerae bacterium]|nr:winged helix-turn-helix transcriptional regulator [Lentisphaerota bacterium]
MSKSSKSKTEPLPAEWLDKMAHALGVLAHPLRLRIIEILEACTEAPVHEITARLGVPQAAASHHLNKMKTAGLIRSERRQKEMWYRIADPDSLTILNCIRKKRNRT